MFQRQMIDMIVIIYLGLFCTLNFLNLFDLSVKKWEKVQIDNYFSKVDSAWQQLKYQWHAVKSKFQPTE